MRVRILLVCTIVLILSCSAFAGSFSLSHFSPRNINELFLGGDPYAMVQQDRFVFDIGLCFEGRDEIHIPLWAFSPGGSGEQVEWGIGVLAHYYFRQQTKGLFIGGGSRFFLVSNDVFPGDHENATSFSLTPTLSAGYRLKYRFLTIAPRYEVGYNISTNSLRNGLDQRFVLEVGFALQNPGTIFREIFE